MKAFKVRAEVARLSRLLDVPTEQAAALAELDADTLRQLREQATAMLYDAQRESLSRVATATRLLPATLAAMLAERSLGPLLCARIAAYLPDDTAYEIARRLSDEFLVEVCLQLDPRRAQGVVRKLPAERCTVIGLALVRRREYVTIGSFVDILDFDVLATVLAALDDATLLHAGFYAEDRLRLSRIVADLPPARFESLIDAALADDGALWSLALALMADLLPIWQRRFGECALRRDPGAISRMLALSDALDLWPVLLAIVDPIDDPDCLARLHDALLDCPPDRLVRLRNAADGHPTLARLQALDWPAAVRALL
ncbi:hypothetical protein [Solimonas marina]|uniref:Uncharacterized protein n=1 Tax=Solimonas marina TaxID=2714601 RepID=A0A969W8J3_9GAMM|nr:hypothetical protein [Solimonas marina]NKF21453.1 hypothetical protein [Solimonas marina]